jgi:hypothetical protein
MRAEETASQAKFALGGRHAPAFGQNIAFAAGELPLTLAIDTVA